MRQAPGNASVHMNINSLDSVELRSECYHYHKPNMICAGILSETNRYLDEKAFDGLDFSKKSIFGLLFIDGLTENFLY